MCTLKKISFKYSTNFRNIENTVLAFKQLWNTLTTVLIWSFSVKKTIRSSR